MKKEVWITAILLTIVFLLMMFLLLFSGYGGLGLVVFGLVFIIGILGILERVKSASQNMPFEDELSKKIKQKSAAIAFYLSLPLWFFVALVDNFHLIETRKLFLYGFMGMIVLYGIAWLFFRLRGRVNE